MADIKIPKWFFRDRRCHIHPENGPFKKKVKWSEEFPWRDWATGSEWKGHGASRELEEKDLEEDVWGDAQESWSRMYWAKEFPDEDSNPREVDYISKEDPWRSILVWLWVPKGKAEKCEQPSWPSYWKNVSGRQHWMWDRTLQRKDDAGSGRGSGDTSAKKRLGRRTQGTETGTDPYEEVLSTPACVVGIRTLMARVVWKQLASQTLLPRNQLRN